MKTVFVILFLINIKVVVLANVDSLKISVFFDIDSSVISSIEYERLKSSIIGINPIYVSKIIIKAYCDDTGSKLYNDLLSAKRALHVETVIKEIFQLKQSNVFELYGKGSLPIDANQSILIMEQRNRNRKAEIVIVNKIDSINHIHKIEESTGFLLRDINVGESVELKHILFVAGKSQFLSQSYVDLKMLVKYLNENKSYHIKIVGHINYTQNNRYDLPNKESKDLDTGFPLSVERAKAVYNFLIHKGIDAERLSFDGQGGLQPTEKGGLYDRRVEIVVIKK
ncbi:MAG: OmpA family protein [Candidatus Paceibacterota bacterium]